MVRALFSHCDVIPYYGALGPKKPEAYKLLPKAKGHPLFVIGPYGQVCGGCDAIQPFDLILNLLAKYANKGHVLFEGAIIGNAYGRASEMMEASGKHGIFLVLDTPEEECIRRVQSRRSERGDDRELNPKNLRHKFKQLNSVLRKVEKDDILRIIRVKDTDAVDTILDLIREAPEHVPPKSLESFDLFSG